MYNIFVSDEFHHNTFTAKTRGDAMELYTIAIRSGMYDYVSISKIVDSKNVLCEWEANNDA